MSTRNKKHCVGAVVAVPLEGGAVGYGRLLPGSYVEFFDVRLPGVSAPDARDVVRHPVLFRTAVENQSVNRWRVIGVVELGSEYAALTLRFSHRDLVSGELSIRWRDVASGRWGEFRAERAECIGLEPSAVWSGEGIEGRLSDHFAGRPNGAVDELRIQ